MPLPLWLPLAFKFRAHQGALALHCFGLLLEKERTDTEEERVSLSKSSANVRRIQLGCTTSETTKQVGNLRHINTSSVLNVKCIKYRII